MGEVGDVSGNAPLVLLPSSIGVLARPRDAAELEEEELELRTTGADRTLVGLVGLERIVVGDVIGRGSENDLLGEGGGGVGVVADAPDTDSHCHSGQPGEPGPSWKIGS